MAIIFVMIFVVLFFICSLPFLGVEWLIARKDRAATDLPQLRLVQWFFRVVMKISGVKLEVIGEENVPTDEAVLYVCNHRGVFDVVAAYSRCPRPTGFIAKISLSKIPIFSIYMNRLHCLFMDRDDIKQSLKIILAAIDKIKEGVSIFIFPEGTRNRDYDHPEAMLPFKEGSFKIATKTGCKIVPVAVIGSDQVMEAHSPWIHPHKVTLIYGKPVDPKALSKEELKHIGATVQAIVQGMLNEQLGIKTEDVKTEAEVGKTEAEAGKTEAEAGKTEAEVGKTEAEVGKTEAEVGKAE